jgi:hypothetical protein
MESALLDTDTLSETIHERLPSPFKPLTRKERPGPQSNETHFLRRTGAKGGVTLS